MNISYWNLWIILYKLIFFNRKFTSYLQIFILHKYLTRAAIEYILKLNLDRGDSQTLHKREKYSANNIRWKKIVTLKTKEKWRKIAKPVLGFYHIYRNKSALRKSNNTSLRSHSHFNCPCLFECAVFRLRKQLFWDPFSSWELCLISLCFCLLSITMDLEMEKAFWIWGSLS